MRSELYS